LRLAWVRHEWGDQNGLNKPIILITSCERDRLLGAHHAIRETWAASGADRIEIRFLLGRGGKALCTDEWLLDAPDCMEGVAWKTREGHRRAIEAGFGHAFQVFTDTYVDLGRLLASGFEARDYIGCFPRYAPGLVTDGGYAFGGPGYWLSRRASEILLASRWPVRIPRRGAAEDYWVGNVLHGAGIDGWNDPRYRYKGELGLEGISVHVGRVRGSYDPAWIREAHRLHTFAK
jgi:hypothetical protein